MARVRALISGSSDPEPKEIGRASRDTTGTGTRSSPRKPAAKPYSELDGINRGGEGHSGVGLRPKVTAKPTDARRQVRLAPLPAKIALQPPGGMFPPVQETKRAPKRQVKSEDQRLQYLEDPFNGVPVLASTTGRGSESSCEVEMEESIWCGSDSSSDDDDEQSLGSDGPRAVSRRTNGAIGVREKALNLGGRKDLSSRTKTTSGPNHTLRRPSPTTERYKTGTADILRPSSSSDQDSHGAILRFSPPRLYSPPKAAPLDRPVTPPQSPSKARLQSPSKTKMRVPTPTLRQSLDAFWNVKTVNEWNDQYSPQKPLQSPTKSKPPNAPLESPTSSPRKAGSPSKRSRAEIDAKKAFEERKHRIAEDFLRELDDSVTDGQIRTLTTTTGGVQFVWSKTLKSTAGRANWRKATTRSRKPDGSVETTLAHYASIELAEKVIDDEHRLLNVVAHEFCHLANFMVSGIKDQPHGRDFKKWGQKCTRAFRSRGVEVTTKHSYEIEYKYVWLCDNADCAAEFKRHSKSINPERHKCGSCRGTLRQVRPAPRRGHAGYAAFVKCHFGEMKKSLPGASQREVMEAIGRKYRQEKAGKQTAVAVGTDEMEALVDQIEVISLVDD